MAHREFLEELLAIQDEGEAMAKIIDHKQALERREFIKEASIAFGKALAMKSEYYDIERLCENAKKHAEALADEVLK